MMQANIHEAKTHLSRLLKKVLLGEEIIISKAGKPVAKLVPYEGKPADRVPGRDRGLIEIPEGFDEELPEAVRSDFEQ
jgi:prevent-host-death family protein